MKRGHIDLNPEFRKAIEVIEKSNHNVFITGKAGTGKSTLLDYFRNNTRKEVAVLAPTGVAALNVQGQTIHSFFGFKPSITPDKVKRVPGRDGEIYREFKTIIIDEVSMVRADLLDCVEKFLRLNGPDKKQWFGGVQMVFVGDLYQLPPVVASSEREIFSHRYETPYFFSASVFAEPTFEMEFIELEKVYRQKDEEFIGLLNAIRNKTCTEEDLKKLNQRLDPSFVPPEDAFCVTLTSTNDLAMGRNMERLSSLPGHTMEYPAVLTGAFDRSSLPAEETLRFKEGAQVMLVNNDKEGRWVNGSIGKVAGTERGADGEAIVMVALHDGSVVEVMPCTWELFEYQYDRTTKKISTRKTGAFTQYPIRLAWAVTIHKSQGKTFDRVVIDLGRSAFAHGQVYVALSRCTSLTGITLARPVTRSDIRTDWRVSRFLTRFQYRRAEEQVGYDERRGIIEDAMRRDLDLEILYLKPNDTKFRRVVHPVSIEQMEYKGKVFEGLRAYCRLRKGERVFRIERILEIAYAVN